MSRSAKASGNFTGNLGEPLTFVNHVLQGQIPDAGATFGRFVINSTIGVAGIFDPAIRHGHAAHERGFRPDPRQVGRRAGPYLVLPFLGSTNPRDLVGKGGDAALNPLNYPEFENDDEIRMGITVLRRH